MGSVSEAEDLLFCGKWFRFWKSYFQIGDSLVINSNLELRKHGCVCVFCVCDVCFVVMCVCLCFVCVRERGRETLAAWRTSVFLLPVCGRLGRSACPGLCLFFPFLIKPHSIPLCQCHWLNPFLLLSQNTGAWVAYEQQIFLSPGSGGWKVQVQGGVGSVSDEGCVLIHGWAGEGHILIGG